MGRAVLVGIQTTIDVAIDVVGQKCSNNYKGDAIYVPDLIDWILNNIKKD